MVFVPPESCEAECEAFDLTTKNRGIAVLDFSLNERTQRILLAFFPEASPTSLF
jgi:hypothetical protein